MKKTIKKLIDYINNNLATYEVAEEELLEGGAIYYRNSNDGTAFDWEENGRTCEFMSFYKSSDLGAFKVWVQADGYITGFLYLDEGKGEPIELEPEFIGIQEAEEFKSFLNIKADVFQIWNADIREIFK